MAVASGNSLVSAQACTAQLGSPTISPQQYYGSNLQVTVPVSTTCSIYTNQLFVTGTAYDTTYNSNIGTTNTVLSAPYGGYGASGQLQFNLPASVVSHSVEFSVSIYSSQSAYYQPYYGGSLLTTTSEAFLLGPSYPYSPTYPTYPYSPTYTVYPTYPSSNYPTYPTYTIYPTYLSRSYYPSNNYYYGPYSNFNQNPVGYYYRNGYYYNNYACTPRNNCFHR